MAPDVDLEGVARRTPGFTGADLANVLNEAALLTARQNARLITDEYLDEAIDRVVAGPQKRSRLMNDKEKLVTAYHEGGHALVAAALPGTDPVEGHHPAAWPGTRLHHGAAGAGQVRQHSRRAARPACVHDGWPCRRGAGLPRPDHGRQQRHREGNNPGTRHGHSVRHDRAAGRDQARIRRRGTLPGPRHRTRPRLLGRVAAIVDEEVSKLISNAHQEAFDILNENRDVLDDLVRALFEKETLDRDQVAAVFQPLRLWPKRPAWTGSDERIPSPFRR